MLNIQFIDQMSKFAYNAEHLILDRMGVPHVCDTDYRQPSCALEGRLFKPPIQFIDGKNIFAKFAKQLVQIHKQKEK
jgi:hypothetical protein